MVVLEPDFRLTTRSDDTWAEPPAAALTRCVTDALAATGHFSDVGDAFNMAHPDMIMTGELRAFNENRTVQPRVAEVELRVELREARSPKVLWAGTLREVEPMAGDKENALAVAMNAAVSRVCATLARSLSALEYVAVDPDAALDLGKK